MITTHRVRLLTIGLAVLVFTIIQSPVVRADDICISFFPSNLSVLENTTNNRIDITVANLLSFSTGNGSDIRILGVTFTLKQTGGDLDDMAVNGALVLPSVPPGTIILKPVGTFPNSFTFSFVFDAVDGSGVNDHDVGLWELAVRVVFERPNIPNSGNTAVTGTTIIEVRDPGAVSTLPEPSTMLLLSTGLAGVAMKMRKRFKSRRRVYF